MEEKFKGKLKFLSPQKKLESFFKTEKQPKRHQMSPDSSSRPHTDLRSSKQCLNNVFTNQSDCDLSRRAARRRLMVCWLFFLLKPVGSFFTGL